MGRLQQPHGQLHLPVPGRLYRLRGSASRCLGRTRTKPGSISRSDGKKYRTVGRSQGRAHARGKVRGIVENWERSGSESSLGGVDGGVCMIGVLLTRNSFNRHVILGAKILLSGLRVVSLIIIRRRNKTCSLLTIHRRSMENSFQLDSSHRGILFTAITV